MKMLNDRADAPLQELNPLAHAQPLRTWAGRGTGALCHYCCRTIGGHEIEYEVELAPAESGKSWHFHLNCYRSWEDEGDLR